jgi:hypothetical protein
MAELNPNIALQGLLINRNDENAKQQRYQMNQRAMQEHREDRQREKDRRASLSDLLLAQGGGYGGNPASGPYNGDNPPPSTPTAGPMTDAPAQSPEPGRRLADLLPSPSGMPEGQPSAASALTGGRDQSPMQANDPMQQAAQSAWQRLVRVDPDGAMKVRKSQFDSTKEEIQLVGTLASGVNDQASYDDALRRASGYGLDVSHLPRQYSPELIHAFQMQAAGAAQALQSIARDRRLQWDMEDDQADNQRADRSEQSLEDYRAGQLENTQRGQDMTDARIRGSAGYRGKPKVPAAPSPPRSENALYTDIQRRFNAGEPVTDRERQFAHDYQRRHGGREPQPRGKARGSSAADGAIIRNPRTGQRMQLQNGRWVPVK